MSDNPEDRSMSKHTPGPWKVEPGGFVGGPVGKGRVCQTWNKFEQDFPNAEANARLIAAAPDLLSAAKAKLAACRMDGGCESVQDDEYCSYECVALASAIAKAEGA
jgi:hypothetical protein